MLDLVRRSVRGLQDNLEKQQKEYSLYNRFGLGWLNRKLLKHQSNAVTRQHKFQGVAVHYRNGNELLHTMEEIFIREIYKADMPSHPYIIDGGTNIGLSVLYFLRQFPDAKIDAFEPDTANFQLLQLNTAAHTEQVTLHQAALWKENGVVSFSASGDMGSKIESGEVGSTEQVAALRLRDFINKKVDFLKLDIEGAEYEVVMDIADRLDLVDRLFLEYHGSFAETFKLTHLLNTLQEAGFHCYVKEAAEVYAHPFYRNKAQRQYDVQLNIFFFKP